METESNNNPTVMSVLLDVVKTLGDIDVPASKIEQIGIPLAKGINGINLCIEALARADIAAENEKKQNNGEDDHEPEIQVVETGTVPMEDVNA